jgi:hypothetical protein
MHHAQVCLDPVTISGIEYSNNNSVCPYRRIVVYNLRTFISASVFGFAGRSGQRQETQWRQTQTRCAKKKR